MKPRQPEGGTGMTRQRNKTPTPFGRLVLKALIDRDMTRAALAEAVGITPQYLSYILNGTRSGKKYIEAIARELDLDQRKVRKTTAA